MSSNKTIAKNTLFLYVRMFFNMGVSLLVSRVALKVLGVEDFGIYNLVGGVVVLFSFLNSSMSSGTQRYINFEKASGEINDVNKIFNISLVNHFLIVGAVVILAETVGLWFLNFKLNIPADRYFAANIVYQFSILTTIVGIIRTPFSAMLLAYERMSYYSYIGILETFLKLTVVYLLYWFTDQDSLIMYSFMLMIVNFLVNLVLFFYCRKYFYLETKFKLYKDLAKTKELLSFSGWMIFGQLAVVFATQGLSMILNIFFGVVVNAALGIANQVNAAVFSFVANFQIAFNPQIVQSYASNDLARNRKLVINASKYSFFLMSFLAAPVLFFTSSILNFWLGDNVPEYVEEFIKIIILCSLIDALSGPFWMSAAAIAQVKQYNIPLTIINMCILPIAYVLLKTGFSPIYVFIAKFVISLFMQGFRYKFIDKALGFTSKEVIIYFRSILVVFVLLIMVALLMKGEYIYNILEIIIGSTIIMLTLCIIILIIGVDQYERLYFYNILKQRVKKT